AQVVVGLELVVGGGELVDHREVERVALGGPAQPHQQHVTASLQRDLTQLRPPVTELLISAIGTSTRSDSRSPASFLSSSSPIAETSGIPKLPQCLLGGSTVSPARPPGSSQMTVRSGA